MKFRSSDSVTSILHMVQLNSSLVTATHEDIEHMELNKRALSLLIELMIDPEIVEILIDCHCIEIMVNQIEQSRMVSIHSDDNNYQSKSNLKSKIRTIILITK